MRARTEATTLHVGYFVSLHHVAHHLVDPNFDIASSGSALESFGQRKYQRSLGASGLSAAGAPNFSLQYMSFQLIHHKTT